MMSSRYKKDKRRTPSHMTEGMGDCLQEMFSLIEGINLVFGQYQGTAATWDTLFRTSGETGSVNPNTIRSARENISAAGEECTLLLDLETESMQDLTDALMRVEQEHPSGEEVPRQMMQEIDKHLSQFIDDFLEIAIERGESDPDNLIWGKG